MPGLRDATASLCVVRVLLRGVARVRLPAESAPVTLLDIDTVMLRRLLVIGEREIALRVRDALHLIEARQRVPDIGYAVSGSFRCFGKA